MTGLKKFIGIPFEENGRAFTGADCWGLVSLFYRELFNIDLPDYRIGCVSASLISETVERESSTETWRKVDIPEFGNVVLLSTDSRDPMLKNHIGVWVGDGRILHTTGTLGSHTVRAESHMAGLIRGFYVFVGATPRGCPPSVANKGQAQGPAPTSLNNR